MKKRKSQREQTTKPVKVKKRCVKQKWSGQETPGGGKGRPGPEHVRRIEKEAENREVYRRNKLRLRPSAQVAGDLGVKFSKRTPFKVVVGKKLQRRMEKKKWCPKTGLAFRREGGPGGKTGELGTTRTEGGNISAFTAKGNARCDNENESRGKTGNVRGVTL